MCVYFTKAWPLPHCLLAVYMQKWSRLLNGDYLSYITVNEIFFWLGKNKEYEDATLRSD